MKALKLLIVAVVVVGLCVVIFSLIGGGFSSSSIEGTSAPLYTELQSRVAKDWDNADNWNQEVYDKNISDINTHQKDLEKIAANNYRTLMNSTNQKVCQRLVSIVKDEFAKSNCSSSKIANLKAGMDYVVSKNKALLEADPAVKATYARIALYNEILDFGRKPIGLSPNFNIYSGNWSDFDYYKGQTIWKKKNYETKAKDSQLSHITDVNTSLNSIDDKLAKAQKNFETRLSGEIISAYQNVERTPKNQEELQSVYANYYKERVDAATNKKYTYDDNRRLSQFRITFNNEVKAAEEARNQRY